MLEFIQSMDAGALLWVQAHLRTALLDGPMIVISTLGNAGLIWIALGVVLTAIPKTRKYGVLALVSLLVCFLFNNMLLKNLVARPRLLLLRNGGQPDVEHGKAVECHSPSRPGIGHTDRLQPDLCGRPLPHRRFDRCGGRAAGQFSDLPVLLRPLRHAVQASGPVVTGHRPFTPAGTDAGGMRSAPPAGPAHAGAPAPVSGSSRGRASCQTGPEWSGRRAV